MNNVSMTCGVDLVTMVDADGKNIGAGNVAFFTGHLSIPVGIPVNYPCDASDLLRALPDGSLTLRDAMFTPPGALRAPLKILKMCVWVGGDYKIGPFRLSFTSNIFKWPASKTNYIWIEGPTATDQNRPKNFPTQNPDDIDCRSNVEGLYIYIKGLQPRLLIDARDRGQQ